MELRIVSTPVCFVKTFATQNPPTLPENHTRTHVHGGAAKAQCCYNPAHTD
ncbi:hypothetical protein [Paralysiella testudinis]|uniref:Uncharacterized protein n=1 Tax=Paralysiella testudinis TaxID=2809020 RepID=A0A892ZLK4_9NEIS|nr:hypothetical protein [Paralysiella testudinis]QRQ82667.1 hypothetical protein JQU52_04575 [Paralysiella testudinis]